MRGLSGALAQLIGITAALPAAAKKGARTAAERTLERARANAPVKTGRLRTSLHIKEEGISCAVSTDCPYASAVENGTIRAAAQPFLAPAVRESEWIGACENALREALHE